MTRGQGFTSTSGSAVVVAVAMVVAAVTADMVVAEDSATALVVVVDALVSEEAGADGTVGTRGSGAGGLRITTILIPIRGSSLEDRGGTWTVITAGPRWALAEIRGSRKDRLATFIDLEEKIRG
jgi:hypothetical protein